MVKRCVTYTDPEGVERPLWITALTGRTLLEDIKTALNDIEPIEEAPAKKKKGAAE